MKRAILLAVVVCSFAQGQGLLKNAGFSEWAEGGTWPVGWTCAGGKELYRCVNVDGLGSNDSLRYTAQAAGVACQPVVQTFSCEPNTPYVLVAGLKGDGKTKPLVLVNAKGVKGFVARLSTEADTWQRLRTTFNSGGAREFEVQLFGDASTSKTGKSVVGTASFDGVQVYRADQEPKDTAPAVPFVAPGPNLALNKPYTLKPRPNYKYCTDPGDKTQLTDGVYTVGYFWTQPTTVGFSRAYPAVITIDLGKLEPIAGVSFSTAAGVAGVTWPEAIFVLVSDDGKHWRCLDDVVSLSMKHGLPPMGKYATHRFATGDLKACGRYVQIMVAQTPYCFVDEIEVYKGQDEWRKLPPQGKPVASAESFFLETKVVGSIRWRLQSDLDAARTAIRDAKLPAPERQGLLARADALAQRVEDMPKEVPDQFRTVLPLNALHADIYALYAPLLRARGFVGLNVWQANRWDPLQPTDAPKAPAGVSPLRIDLMRGEVRAEALNLLNATNKAQDVAVVLQGFPDTLPIRICDVLFTDTRSRVPIAAALPDARRNADGAFVTVPSGCSKQVWFSVERPAKPLAGEYRGTVQFRAGDWTANVSLTIAIADLDFPEQPTMSFGGWDYTNGNASYYRAPGNVDKLVPMLREHYVDTPWATVGVAPSGAEFDAAGSLTNPDRLEFKYWDEWVERWQGVRNYYVFLSYKNKFHGEELGTPRFNRMVGEYFTAWVDHMTEQGLQPHQLGVLILDEPHDNGQDEIIIPWAKAIRAAQPEIDIFEDPTYRDPTKGLPEMFEACTTLCPNVPMMVAQGDAFREFYEAQGKAGRRLWLYSCSGPAKLLDPINYHRGEQWWAMRIGATGSFYWALGCAGRTGNSWNAYAQTGVEYSPFFVGQTSVTRGKHMEAIREGIQDFEYFVMLRDRVRALAARGADAAKLARARRLLSEAPVKVTTAIDSASLKWEAPKDRGLMDRLRVQMLRELVALK
jgi:hypothetical protein